jgi:hypothetical protein
MQSPAEKLTPALIHERCLLGALVMQPDTGAALARLDGILPQDAISQVHAPILRALRKIAAKGGTGDLVTLAAELSGDGALERMGGPAKLAALVDDCPDTTETGIDKFAHAILEYHGRRKAAHLASIIAAKIEHGEPLDGEIDNLVAATKDGFKALPPDWKTITQSEVVPVSSLADLIDVDVDYLIKPILIKGCLTQLHGAPKGGKSVFALHTALSASIGEWKSGVWAYASDRPANVLYISFEDSPLLIVKRACRYLNGMDYDGYKLPANFHLCDNPTLMMDTAQGNRLLRDKIEELKIDIVVIDTLSYVHQAEDENSSADVKPLMANLKRIVRDLKVSILYIHHSRKGQGDGQQQDSVERARGSSVISAAADVILDWGNRCETNVTEVRLISKYDEGYKFNVTYDAKPDENSVRWTLERLEPEVKEKKPKPQDNYNDVLNTLKAIALQGCIKVKGCDITKIMKDKGISKPTTNRILNRLVADKAISETPQGKGMTIIYEVLKTAQVIDNNP